MRDGSAVSFKICAEFIHIRGIASVLSSRVFNQKRRPLLSIIGATLLIPAVAAPALAAPRRAQAVSSEDRIRDRIVPRTVQFEALPLERSKQNHLLLRASINGKPALLGVDTGAPVSAISINRLAHFGMTPALPSSAIPTRLRINGAFNNVSMAHNLQLGALTLVDEPMVAVDLGGSTKAAKLMKEQAIDGIIGADILFPTNAVVDCRAQMLILKVDPNVRGSAPGINYSGLSKVPMQVSPGYNLYVDSRVNGKPIKLMVDTGAFATLLHQRFVRRMKIPLRESPFSSAGVNLAQRGVQFATISKFSVGSVDMRDKQVGVINLEGLVRNGLLDASPPVAGLLGSEILQHHNGIIDFGTKTLYLKR